MTQRLAKDERLSPRAYLDFEGDADWREMRHEYEEGRLIPKIGASFNHARIAGNLAFSFQGHLPVDVWDLFIADIKVEIEGGRCYYYPDLLVAPRAKPQPDHLIFDPLLVAEILSPTTERRDRSVKLRNYQAVPALQHILLIAQDSVHVEHHRRIGETWHTETLGAGDVIDLPSLDLAIPLDTLYVGLDWSGQG